MHVCSYHFPCRGQRWGRRRSVWHLYPDESWDGSGDSSLWSLPLAFVTRLSEEAGSSDVDKSWFQLLINIWKHTRFKYKPNIVNLELYFWCFCGYYMFPDVMACFSVSPAALRQQIEDWCHLLFDLIALRRKQKKSPSGCFSISSLLERIVNYRLAAFLCITFSLTDSRRLSMNCTRVWTQSMLTPWHCSEPGCRGTTRSTSRHWRGSADNRLTVWLRDDYSKRESIKERILDYYIHR